ncbi:MAG: sulfotransferase family protein [Actinomycetota bacterium]
MKEQERVAPAGTSARLPTETDGTLPSFFIAGAMRSGTTSLTRYLDAHPEVFVSRPKEIHYFDVNYPKGIDWYRGHFSTVAGEHAIGDATPSYMYLGDAVVRMAQAVPEARIIALLRNPVDRAYSHYRLRRAVGAEQLDFVDAIAAELQRLELGDPRRACPYLDMSRYVSQLRHLCRHFRREAVHVVIFEALRDEPQHTYSEVCRFLGVDDTFVPPNLGQVVNASVTYRSMGLRKMRHRLPRPVWRVVGRLNTRRASYPPLDPALRAGLTERFAQDNAELAAWLGHDLAMWET